MSKRTSKRKYDPKRVQANEMRRIKLAKNKPWIIGPYYRNEFSAMVDSPMGDPQHMEAVRLVNEQNDRSETRTCSNGNCTVVYDPKAGKPLYSMGPVGCCDE